ncbi:Chromosome partition protein Smc [Pelotomaculum sp. FP]|nr:Chromosome partition protein Smc [Pelotomaculum sp. FP]
MSSNQDSYSIGYNRMPNPGSIGVNQENTDFNALFERSLQSELDSKLRNSVVGGYSKKSVENFVSEMRDNLQQIKTQLERQVQDLAAEKASVSQECSVLRSQLKAAEENLAESRNQIVSQQYRDETQCASEQELQYYRLENERLRGMLLDYQQVKEQKEKYEELLAQKEQEIAQLNETLAEYRRSYDELKERTEQLEKSLDSSSRGSSEEKMTELKRQKDEIMAKYQALLQHMEKTNQQFEQKKQHLDETQTQLEQEKQYLTDARAQLEREKQHLTETQAQLKTDIQKNRTLGQQLENDQQSVRQKEDGISGHMAAKVRTIDALRRKQEESQCESGDLEKKIETLYLHYAHSVDKIKQQEKIISEKDLLLEHYQQQEKDNILIRQENENAKKIISSLRKSLEQIMAHMDAQSEGINLYVTHSLQERDALKAAVSERTALQLRNIELMEQQSCLSVKMEELEAKITQLEEALKQQNSAKRIIPLGDSSDGHKTEDSAELNLDISRDAYQKARELFRKIDRYNSSFEDKTKAADIS